MLIILEGPDCAGKTTLANRLVDALRTNYVTDQVTYRHASVPTEHPLDEYVAPLLDYRPGTRQHTVCDRWHVGESVYPNATGRHTDLTEDVRAYVELFLRSRGALLVYCTATAQHLTDCGVARGDDVNELLSVGRVASAFDREVAESLLPKLIVNVSDPDTINYGNTVNHILALANDEEEYAERLVPFTTYVGSPQPRLLLVGDRRGPDRVPLADYGHWPAFAPRASTSGSWLLTTLALGQLRVPSHGLLLNDVGLANACDVDDVRDLWDVLGRPLTVGLGVNAQRVLRARRVPHHPARHPQYQRRFLHHQRDDYLRSLLAPLAVTA